VDGSAKIKIMENVSKMVSKYTGCNVSLNNDLIVNWRMSLRVKKKWKIDQHLVKLQAGLEHSATFLLAVPRFFAPP